MLYVPTNLKDCFEIPNNTPKLVDFLLDNPIQWFWINKFLYSPARLLSCYNEHNGVYMICEANESVRDLKTYISRYTRPATANIIIEKLF